MEKNEDHNLIKKVPRPEIKIAGRNTILSYHLRSFYELYLATSQINEILSNFAMGAETFTLKRDIKIEGVNDEEAGIGIILRFTIPKRINDMSLIGTAINSSGSAQ